MISFSFRCSRRAIFACALAASVEAASAAGEEPEKISARQAKNIMTREPQAVVVDVREPEEFAAGHVKGAVNYPLSRISAPDGLPAAVIPSMDAIVLVYCRSGVRSAKAATALSRAGYRRVYDFGGILSWPYETETGSPH